MKFFVYSFVSLFLSFFAMIFYDEFFVYNLLSDYSWNYRYGGYIRGTVLVLAPLSALFTYFAILRRHAAKRRKVMASSYGRADCPVMAEFDEAVKMLKRADYGMAHSASAASPPPLPVAAPDQGAEGIRAKLLSLQRMNEDGLITDEEYAAKKGELLNQM